MWRKMRSDGSVSSGTPWLDFAPMADHRMERQLMAAFLPRDSFDELRRTPSCLDRADLHRHPRKRVRRRFDRTGYARVGTAAAARGERDAGAARARAQHRERE